MCENKIDLMEKSDSYITISESGGEAIFKEKGSRKNITMPHTSFILSGLVLTAKNSVPQTTANLPARQVCRS